MMKNLTNQSLKDEETWSEERPTKRKRDRDTYLSPPSKKINLKWR